MNAAASVLRVPVTGIHCAGCVAAIEDVLASVAGVERVEVSLATEEASVWLLGVSEPQGFWQEAAQALEAGGYGLRVRTTRLHLDAAGQDDSVESGARARLARLPGVQGVETDGGTWTVRHVDHPQVLRAVTALAIAEDAHAGVETESLGVHATRRQSARGWLLRLLLAAPLTGVCVLEARGVLALPPAWLVTVGAVLQFVAGAPFMTGTWRALRRGRADMNVLVALGTLAAFVVSVATVAGMFPPPTHFQTAGMILTFVILGRWLEARARMKTGDAVEALVRLEPAAASRRQTAGGYGEVAVGALQVGDLVRVRPGERVPADGVVRTGTSALDESLVTGEAMPVVRAPGDPAIAGALNGDGVLEVELTAVGDDSTLRRLAEWVRAAQAARAPIARMADRVAAVFVPVVLVLAVLTFLGWALVVGGSGGIRDGLAAAVAVLVVACPCALGLATPLAIVVGVGRSARAGVLFGSGEALERAAAIQHVLFDKTGTLTEGRPAIRFAHAFDLSEALLLRFAAAVERHAEHPLARAVVTYAANQGLEPRDLPEASDVRAVPGSGVEGTVTGKRTRIGTAAWLESCGVDVAAGELLARRMEGHAATVLWVAIDGTLRGLLGATDAIRSEAPEALARLRGRDISVGVLSGDRPAAVARVAMKLAIDDVGASQRPEAKAEAVGDRVASGTVIAFVGDGINDGPALAAADVGIAMHGATDVAASAAALALARPDLRLVPEALALARTTLATIRENLGLAFVYNVVGLPLAALGILPPAFAAAAMALSSLSVVLNSLRLRSRALR